MLLIRGENPRRRQAENPLNLMSEFAGPALGFKISVDDSYAPFKTKGYLPCTFDGEDAGFDLRFENVEEVRSAVLSSALERRDTAMMFRWTGDPRELLAALAVCAALVKDFGAIVHEPEQDKLFALDALLAMATKARESY
jgi:hypothetical protein